MTNREYILQNPKEMRNIIKKATQYVEKEFGYHERMLLPEEDLLEKWLNAEYEQPEVPIFNASMTYIANISIIMHNADGMNIDEARQIARVIVAGIKERFALSSYSIDDVTDGKVSAYGND